jgi:pimeloyl-[acyl-carrier protein] methyl ester esterase
MTLRGEADGGGADIVLLHGWGTGAGVWRELGAELAQRFRVHAVDLPGYGASPACEPYTPRRMAEELAAGLPAKCHVCAWSLGGHAALAWARLAPAQVARIALIAFNPCFTSRPGWPHGMAASELLAFSRALESNRAGTLARFALLQARGDRRERHVARRLRAALRAQGEPGPDALRRGLQILMNEDVRAVLAAVTQPVLVVHGERDALVPLGAAEFLSAALPHARLAVVDGAGHAPFLARPRQTGALLAGFFDER